jgi:hypothetical protein
MLSVVRPSTLSSVTVSPPKTASAKTTTSTTGGGAALHTHNTTRRRRQLAAALAANTGTALVLSTTSSSAASIPDTGIEYVRAPPVVTTSDWLLEHQPSAASATYVPWYDPS